MLGDREFCAVALGQWLSTQDWHYCLRLRRNEYIRAADASVQSLGQVGLQPGLSLFFPEVNVTKQRGAGTFNVACKWQRNYRKKVRHEGWFLLTNLNTLSAAIAAYQKRSGVEAMFKDCKTGGYNLKGCHAGSTRLSAMILLMAIAYTSALIQGIEIRTLGSERYVCRPKETHRQQRRHSNFWVGLYGQSWLNTLELCIDWVGQWMRLNRNKRLYYQRAVQALDLIQPGS